MTQVGNGRFIPATAQRLKFGEFELDLRSGELWKNGARIVLPNQLFRILSVLIERRGNLVTRDELGREIWPEDTFVDFEHSLNAGIRRLRQVIGDSAAAPQFIETIPQRGYRFIAGVEESSATLSNENAAAPLQEDFPPAGTGTNGAGGPRNWPLVSVVAVVVLIAIVFVLVGSWGRFSSVDATHRSLIRLTSTSGLNTDPTLSPDGALLAYASDRGGADFDIYVQVVAGGDPVRLTNNPAEESEPSFAPDGAHIVFSRRGAGLYIVGALGGEPRLIVRTPWARTPKFSPDGRWISYWTGFPASVVAGGIPGALGSILIVPSEAGSPREIVTHLASARYPIWSPDGEHILFLGEENPDQKTHDWYVVPRDGGRAIKTGTVQALRAAGLDTPFPIPGTWMARNNAVVFASNETDSSNLWQIRIAPATGRVSGIPERLTFGTAIERHPVIANSGRIAFASIVEKIDIWRVPLDARTGVATGPLERVTNDAANDRLRSVSSDGRTLFFLSSRTRPHEVWIKDLQTGLERQLSTVGLRKHRPARMDREWHSQAKRRESGTLRSSTRPMVCRRRSAMAAPAQRVGRATGNACCTAKVFRLVCSYTTLAPAEKPSWWHTPPGVWSGPGSRPTAGGWRSIPPTHLMSGRSTVFPSLATDLLRDRRGCRL